MLVKLDNDSNIFEEFEKVALILEIFEDMLANMLVSIFVDLIDMIEETLDLASENTIEDMFVELNVDIFVEFTDSAEDMLVEFACLAEDT